MGQDRRFEKWAGGLLGAVSLILALHLAWSYFLPRHESRSRAIAQQFNSKPPSAPAPLRISTANNSAQAATKERRRDQELSAANTAEDSNQPLAARATLHEGNPEQFEPKKNGESDGARPIRATDPDPVEVAQSLTAPPPATQTFETIGYVEKPDGTKQAVVSKGDQVFVVHEGEVFDEHYRVLSISFKAVEAADLTVPQSAPVAAPDPTTMASRASSPPPRHAANETQTTVAAIKPLGFVERPGRPREAVVADEDGVRLVVPRGATPESKEGLVAGTLSAPAGDDIPPTLVSSRQPSSVAVDQFSKPSDLAAQAGLPTIGQSEVATTVPAEGAQKVYAMDSEPPGLGSTTEAGFSRGWSSGFVRDVAARHLSEPPGAARASPREHQILKAFCYVERPKSGREAFIALGDKVHSVREGTILANRYRVLVIRPEGVEVEDASEETRPPPIPGREFAENRTLPDEASELANHSPPADLPWSGFVRSVAFLWANFAIGEVSPGAEPRLFAQKRPEPTLEESGSSTSSVGVGPRLKSTESNSTTAYSTKVHMTPEGQVGEGLESSVPSHRLRGGATEAAHALKSEEIAWLPFKINVELLALPGQPKGSSLGGSHSAAGSPAIAELGSLPSPGGLKSAKVPAEGGSSTRVPAFTTASLLEISSISARDLQLPFSIGDNGCYFPY